MSTKPEAPLPAPPRRLPPWVWVPLLIVLVGGLLYLFSAGQGSTSMGR